MFTSYRGGGSSAGAGAGGVNYGYANRGGGGGGGRGGYGSNNRPQQPQRHHPHAQQRRYGGGYHSSPGVNANGGGGGGSDAYAAEEGEDDGGGDEDEYDQLQRPAFAIGGDDETEDETEAGAPPATAEAYLRSVRKEARRCPAVVKSNINPRLYDNKQTKYMPKIERSATCRADLLPTAEWERSFASEFADVRQAMARFEDANSNKAAPPAIVTSTAGSGHGGTDAHAARPKFPVKSDAAGWVQFCIGSEYVYAGFASASASAPASNDSKHSNATATKAAVPTAVSSGAATAAAATAAMADDEPDATAGAGDGGDGDDADGGDAEADESATALAAAAATALPTAPAAAATAAAGVASSAPATSASAAASGLEPKAPLLTLIRHLDHQRTRSLLINLIEYAHAHITKLQPLTAAAATATASAAASTTAVSAAAPSSAAPPASGSGSDSGSAMASAECEALGERSVWPLTPALSVWLYVLLAKSHKPIDMSTAAALRTLYRDCTILRARIVDARVSALARINILLTIVHRIFDQKLRSAEFAHCAAILMAAIARNKFRFRGIN